LLICGYKIHGPRVQVLSINHLICVLDTPKSVVDIRFPPLLLCGYSGSLKLIFELCVVNVEDEL
jgi:hypothetical protein